MAHTTTGPWLTISEVSSATGMSPHTLRYYERIGLMTPVERSESGHRRYSIDTLGWLAFLRRLRATGMSIADMKHMADLMREGDATIPNRLAILERHRDSIERQIADLTHTLDEVNAKIAVYNESTASAPAEAIEKLERSA